MALKTAFTELFGLKHPIALAPMALVAGGRLAAAVSDAGGLGLIGGGYGDPEWTEREIAAAGNSRYGVGFITWKLQENIRALELALAANPASIMLSFAEDAGIARRVSDAGVPLIWQVQSVEQARFARDHGAAVIVAQGSEAGGHGAARATLPLVPAVVDAVAPIPVLAAGGIADGRGLAAALMLGAAGILAGSRFYASAEALSHPAAKQKLVAASGDHTLRSSVFDRLRRIDWPRPYDIRTLANPVLARWDADPDGLSGVIDAEIAAFETARDSGDFDHAAVIAGEAADLINDAPPAGELVARMAAEAEAALARPPGLLGN
jgi:nitronate monooxygenase